MAYQTKQQQAVLQCLQHRSEECLSAADLSEELRRSGLTFAPEAGTQRLRDVINKNVTEEEVLRTCLTDGRGGALPVLSAGKPSPRLFPAAVRTLWPDGASGLRPSGGGLSSPLRGTSFQY